MTPPTLSICIPTYNRAWALKRLLRSMGTQLTERVEVVVCDNASTDGTRRLCRRGDLPAVRYVRHRRNLGFDANIRACVAEARGEAVWIIGDDDWLPRGAISRVLDGWMHAPGSILVGDVIMARDGVPDPEPAPSFRCADYTSFWLEEDGDVAAMIAEATSVRAVFPFISNVIFPRAPWPHDLALAWEGSAYTHLFALWHMALTGVPVVVRRRSLIYASVGKHEHRDVETLAHIQLDLDTLERIAAWMPDPRDRRAWRRVWATDQYTPARLASLEERCRHEPRWIQMRQRIATWQQRAGLDPAKVAPNP